MSDVQALKRRLLIFGVVDVIAIVVAAAGFIGDLVYGVEACRLLWTAGIGVAVAAQIWLVLGMRGAGKET